MDDTLNLSKAGTQPGVSISFKTDSPLVTLMFGEREDTAIRGGGTRYPLHRGYPPDEELVKEYEAWKKNN